MKENFNNTRNIYSHGGFTPKAFEMIQVDGRVGAVYEKIAGRTMLSVMMTQPEKLNDYAKLLAHYHSAIQISVNFVLPTVKEKLRNDIKNVTQLTDLEKEKIFAYLEGLPDGNILCHFDFHPGNIMLRNGKPVIIDWMTACSGDALSDAARTGILLKFSDLPAKVKNEMYCAYLQEYIKLSGANENDMQKWELPIAAARLREWVPKEESKKLLSFVRSLL